MRGRGSRLYAARLLGAATAVLLLHAPALSREPPPPVLDPQPAPGAADLDPNAPLAPLPGLGVPWPDLKPSETTPPQALKTTVKGKK